jgi:hypothetical protein
MKAGMQERFDKAKREEGREEWKKASDSPNPSSMILMCC